MSVKPTYILTDQKSGRHLYGRGWLGLIPLVGGVIGIGLIMLGVLKYKDKKLVLIGAAALLFTVAVYGSLFYYMEYSDTGRKLHIQLAQDQLNDVVKHIEFYKLQAGQYPDSLKQLAKKDDRAWIFDPAGGTRSNRIFIYQKLNDHYILFSAGADLIENTSDDLYPTIDTTGTGLIHK
ncbi:MAG: hypothetical protein ABI480_14545 [Chitinophagaceae bacterium]